MWICSFYVKSCCAYVCNQTKELHKCDNGYSVFIYVHRKNWIIKYLPCSKECIYHFTIIIPKYFKGLESVEVPKYFKGKIFQLSLVKSLLSTIKSMNNFLYMKLMNLSININQTCTHKDKQTSYASKSPTITNSLNVI